MNSRPDLASVLDHYGAHYNPAKNKQKILCPVHEEFIPSCSIDLEANVFNCHACGAHGDSMNLIMEKERCAFASAVPIAEEIIASGGNAVPKSDESTDAGLFGRTRPKSRSGRRAPFRPRLYTDGRP